MDRKSWKKEKAEWKDGETEEKRKQEKGWNVETETVETWSEKKRKRERWRKQNRNCKREKGENLNRREYVKIDEGSRWKSVQREEKSR